MNGSGMKKIYPFYTNKINYKFDPIKGINNFFYIKKSKIYFIDPINKKKKHIFISIFINISTNKNKQNKKKNK